MESQVDWTAAGNCKLRWLVTISPINVRLRRLDAWSEPNVSRFRPRNRPHTQELVQTHLCMHVSIIWDSGSGVYLLEGLLLYRHALCYSLTILLCCYLLNKWTKWCHLCPSDTPITKLTNNLILMSWGTQTSDGENLHTAMNHLQILRFLHGINYQDGHIHITGSHIHTGPQYSMCPHSRMSVTLLD